MIFFAWEEPNTAFSVTHEREDEKITELEITCLEDDFPSATITIKNPRIGLLNPDREFWAWISVGDGSTDPATPLFYGRLVGIPEDLQAEEVQLAFIARPTDYEAQKTVIADAAKVLPLYDPLWIAPEKRAEADAILESRPVAWTTDRVTHVVSLTDINAGEDGIIVFSPDEHFYEDVSVSYGPPPVSKVHCEGTVQWRQVAAGDVDLSEALCAASRAAGTNADHVITSLTGEGLMDDWPRKGDNIGGGWKVGLSSVTRTDGVLVDQEFVTTVFTGGANGADFPMFTMKPVFHAAYSVARNCTEKVVFNIIADVQAVVSDPGEADTLTVTLASGDVEQPIDPADTDHPFGTIPIGDVKRNSYFKTVRGQQSLANLMSMGRAKLLARARAVEVDFGTDWDTGLQLSCRKNAQIFDDRLPGGQALGKIIGYRLTISGEGKRQAFVTIGCTVGQGNTVAAVEGGPAWVTSDWTEAEWQEYEGATVMPFAGVLTYSKSFLSQAVNDDGVNFFDLDADDIIDEITVINGETVQRSILEAYITSDVWGFPDMRAAANAVNEVFTEIDVNLKQLNAGPFSTTYVVTVSRLMVPKTIDLEAEAA